MKIESADTYPTSRDELRAGIWRDVPNETYRAVDAFGVIGTRHVVDTHQRTASYALTARPSASSPAMARGTALHAAVLEPDLFEREYATVDPDRYPDAISTLAGAREYVKSRGLTAKGRSYEDVSAAILAEDSDAPIWEEIVRRQAAGRTILSPEDYRFCAQGGARVRSFAPWIEATEHVDEIHAELSVIAEVRPGLFARARPDLWPVRNGRHAILDLKTARDASPNAWQRAIAGYGSHLQAHLQQLCVGIVTETSPSFQWICVESDPPHECAAYALEFEHAARAQSQLHAAIDALHAAINDPFAESGYAPETVLIELPRWA